jgi:hypothetical protein
MNTQQMNTQQMLNHAIALAKVLNPSEMPRDGMIATIAAIAALAQAEATARIADRLDLLCESGTGYGGEEIAVLRINAA